jgi:histidine triad (HIT) family protein
VTDCVFCEIVAGRAPATIVAETDITLMIVPLGPVVDGHILAIPKTHTEDAASMPSLTSIVMEDVADYARRQARPFNLITSAGREATQSVFHLHIHYVPRAAADGLMVPWGTAWGENPQDPHRCRGMAVLEEQLAQLRSATHPLETR